MSESAPDAEPKPDGDRGRRMWKLRWLNNAVFFVPVWPLLIAVDGSREQSDLGGVLLHGVPWVGLALASGILARALWRIEVNLNENERPFTERDFLMLRKAYAACIGVVAGLVGGYMTTGYLISYVTDEITRGDLYAASFQPMIVSFMLAAVSACFMRVYARGKQAHEELEKGV